MCVCVCETLLQLVAECLLTFCVGSFFLCVEAWPDVSGRKQVSTSRPCGGTAVEGQACLSRTFCLCLSLAYSHPALPLRITSSCLWFLAVRRRAVLCFSRDTVFLCRWPLSLVRGSVLRTGAPKESCHMLLLSLMSCSRWFCFAWNRAWWRLCLFFSASEMKTNNVQTSTSHLH